MGMFGFDEQSVMFDVTPVENQFILEYMLSARGDDVKVYLLGLMYCYRPNNDVNIQQLAKELKMTESEVLGAYRHWERCGLVRRVSDNPPSFCYVNVKQHAMLGVSAQSDPAYEAFADAVYAMFGDDRRIHGSEMITLYEWVQELKLPAEVVILLLRHVMNQRGNKHFDIKAAEKLAQRLADENARTIDDAEQVLSRDTAVWEGSRKVIRRMGKRRMPSQDEMDLYMKWYREWQFAPDAIEAACAQMTKGDPSFAYLDGILKGIMNRKGAVASGEAMDKTLAEEKERIAPLKRLLAALGARELTINDGTQRLYDALKAMYADDEIILLAAAECAPRGGKLDDVYALLEAWKNRGLQSAEQIRSHIGRVKQQDAMLRGLYDIMGVQTKVNNADRRLLEQWQSELAMGDALIRHCAAWAAGTGKPMLYLDKLLKDMAAKGIRTEQEADTAHAAFQQSKPAAAVRPVRQVREQQYEQREYTPSKGLADWMKDMMGEEASKHDQE